MFVNMFEDLENETIGMIGYNGTPTGNCKIFYEESNGHVIDAVMWPVASGRHCARQVAWRRFPSPAAFTSFFSFSSA